MNQVRWITVDYHLLEHPMDCDTLVGEVGDHYRNCMDRVTILYIQICTCTCAFCETQIDIENFSSEMSECVVLSSSKLHTVRKCTFTLYTCTINCRQEQIQNNMLDLNSVLRVHIGVFTVQ